MTTALSARELRIWSLLAAREALDTSSWFTDHSPFVETYSLDPMLISLENSSGGRRHFGGSALAYSSLLDRF